MEIITKRVAGLLSASAVALSLAVIAQPAMSAATDTLVQTAKTGPGIVNSRHNLTNWATLNGNNTSAGGTDQICVFCHTPHGSATVAGAPLWNKGLPAATDFTMYSSDTMDASTGVLGGVSLACLSCHDGTQAMDNMINAPGIGGYTAGGASQGYVFSEFTTFADANGTADESLNLARDLRNDHPVGIQYCGGPVGSDPVGTSCKDQAFKSITNSNSSNGIFYIDTDGDSFRSKSDFSLYTTGGGSNGAATIECATCHDPHSPENGTFLRISNSQSRVCLACHTK